MTRNLVALAFIVGLAAAAWSAADVPPPAEKLPTREDLGKMMAKVHKGKDAPLVRTADNLKKDTPDWDVLAKDAKSFTETADLMKLVRLDYKSPKGYIDQSAAFAAAVKKKDKPEAEKVFAKFMNSCHGCHYQEFRIERLGK